jgi:hypothetical protein
MRNIIVAEFISMEGVIQAPGPELTQVLLTSSKRQSPSRKPEN